MFINVILLLAFLAVSFAEKTKGYPSLSWQSVAIDASGKYQIAAAAYNNDWDQGYPIYVSMDYGTSWQKSKSDLVDWRNTYSDPTGQVLVGYAAYNTFATNSYPPLYVSKDRGSTWETGASTSGFAVTNPIIGNSTSMYTVVSGRLYHSVDTAKSWAQVYGIPSRYGTAYTATIGTDVAFDSTGKHFYAICDTGLCVSHNSGQTYAGNWNVVVSAVEADTTGQYVYIMTDKYLQYSSDFGSTFTTLKDYTVSGANTVTKNFLFVTSDRQSIFTLEKSSAGNSLVRFNTYYKTSSTLYTTSANINDAAISGSGSSIILSTDSGLFYTSANAGSSWTAHDLS